MVFNVCMGLSNLLNKESTDKEGKTYALFIADTVLINETGPATVPTVSKKKIKNIGDSEEEENKEEKENTPKPEILGRGKRSAVIENKLRHEHTSEEKRREHQKELANHTPPCSPSTGGLGKSPQTLISPYRTPQQQSDICTAPTKRTCEKNLNDLRE